MERLTTKFKDGYLFNLPPINDEKAQEEYLEKLSMKIGRYEDAEEQGLILRLPVAIGSEVWKITNQRDNFTDIPYKIVTIVHFRLDMLSEIGKTVFLTREAAEQALIEMKEV